MILLGDITDRGKNNILILLFLKYIKNKYPGRVTFVMGNRDCNKLRLNFEISDDLYRTDIDSTNDNSGKTKDGTYWDNNFFRMYNFQRDFLNEKDNYSITTKYINGKYKWKI